MRSLQLAKDTVSADRQTDRRGGNRQIQKAKSEDVTMTMTMT
jgi:hypothetical protein